MENYKSHMLYNMFYKDILLNDSGDTTLGLMQQRL